MNRLLVEDQTLAALRAVKERLRGIVMEAERAYAEADQAFLERVVSLPPSDGQPPPVAHGDR